MSLVAGTQHILCRLSSVLDGTGPPDSLGAGVSLGHAGALSTRSCAGWKERAAVRRLMAAFPERGRVTCPAGRMPVRLDRFPPGWVLCSSHQEGTEARKEAQSKNWRKEKRTVHSSSPRLTQPATCYPSNSSPPFLHACLRPQKTSAFPGLPVRAAIRGRLTGEHQRASC